MLIRCDVCKGRKKVFGMGGMQKDCGACDGAGTIDEDVASEEDRLPDAGNMVEAKVAGKRGRPRKEQ